jgi:hypothetical protein
MNTTPTTFIEIFGQELNNGKTINGIEIPIIQRDYAQGRKTKEVSRIRERFINVLHKALTGDSLDAVKLDFVYGNIEGGKLIPLDGQQRLTTLFLLHWYVAKRECVHEDQYTFLKKFTYKTRFSSQYFCDSLVECQPDFSSEILSEWIIDQNWFMYSWEKDPTVHAMLVMLDKIHEVFNNEENLWTKLNRPQTPPISFYFLPLEDMGLTDNLYIKMNSRGKPLTEFEHFKAEFEKIIKGTSIELYKEFIKKVDVDWVDMLWKYRGDDNLIDDEFMRYYRFVTEMLCFKQEIEILDNDFDLASRVYGSLNDNAEDNLKFLFKSFDSWKELGLINTFFDSIFSKSSYEEDKVLIYSDTTDLFLLCCNDYGITSGKRRQFSLNNTLLLFATLEYLLNKETVTEVEFKERLRIIRNLVYNSQFEIRETRMQALLNDTRNIMTTGEIRVKTTGFNENQKNEEINKVTWRIQNPTLITDLKKLEDHSLLQGKIRIIGLDEPEKFQRRSSNFHKLFNNTISYNKISKALLTIGDYSQIDSWRCLFGNTNDSTWRELFTPSKQIIGFEKTKSTLLTMLDFISGDFELYLDSLVLDYLTEEHKLKDWKYYFIKYPDMRKGNSGVYYWPNNQSEKKETQYEIIMMNTALSTNGRHWDPFLFVISNDTELKPKLSLEEYAAPLVVNQSGNKIRCKNSNWEICNSEDELLDIIEIDQESGTDIVDRIQVIKNYLNSNI